jgi:hypothetical protein
VLREIKELSSHRQPSTIPTVFVTSNRLPHFSRLAADSLTGYVDWSEIQAKLIPARPRQQ